MLAAQVVEEAVLILDLFLDVSKLVEIHDLVEEVKEPDASPTSRKRRTVNPLAASEPQPPTVEEASPSTVVAKALANLVP